MPTYSRTDSGTFQDVAKNAAADIVVKYARGRAITPKAVGEDVLADYIYENWLRTFMINNSIGFDENDDDAKGINSARAEYIINKTIGKSIIKIAIKTAQGGKPTYMGVALDVALAAGAREIYEEVITST